MHPTFLQVGGLRLSSYWAFMSLGYLAATATLFVLGRRARIPQRHLVVLLSVGTLIGILGAWGLHLLVQASKCLADPSAEFRYRGRAFLGGPLLVIPFILWYCSRFRIPLGRFADMAMPAMTVGHAFGRIGCFLAGCCFGCPTDASWGCVFPDSRVPFVWRGVPLHPTQLYEAAGLFALYGLMLWWTRRRAYEGQVALLYFLVYPLLRYGLETVRGDPSRGALVDGWLSTSQVISLLMFGAALLFVALRKVREERQAADVARRLAFRAAPQAAMGPASPTAGAPTPNDGPGSGAYGS